MARIIFRTYAASVTFYSMAESMWANARDENEGEKMHAAGRLADATDGIIAADDAGGGIEVHIADGDADMARAVIQNIRDNEDEIDARVEA